MKPHFSSVEHADNEPLFDAHGMKMSKCLWLNIGAFALLFASIFINTVILITQSAGLQITVIQNLYWAMDKSWLMIRSAAVFFAAIVGFSFLIYHRRDIVLCRIMRSGIYFSFVGLVLGLVVFYGYSCCETPISFSLGFPFSWLKGLSSVYFRLHKPITVFLLQNFTQIKWHVDMFGLVSDLLFWYAIGITFFLISKRSNFLPWSIEGVVKHEP